MKRIFLSFLSVLVFMVLAQAQGGIEEKLKGIARISDVQKIEVKPFNEYYQFWFEQPVDHEHPEKGVFKQRVLLGHRNFGAPVIAELEGYGIWTKEAGELSALFNGNQLTIEHRFFNDSKPLDGIPWDYLTIKQAAADQHDIIQAIKKNIYPDSKWVSTGISKGGQTTIFHRYFYPDDVDVSVPYVAPLNLELVDERLGKFFAKLAENEPNLSMLGFVTKEGMRTCRWAVFDFQMLCFKNKEKMVPLLQEYANEEKYAFTIAGGVERVLELMILEYPFAFWQWGSSCAEIPVKETDNVEEIFDYLVKISGPGFFSDNEIIKLQPFYYAAMTEIGMYEYDIKPFKKYLDDKKNITFRFTMPKGYENRPFNEKQMKDINRWLQTDAEKMLFIYGGRDPWGATAVDLKSNGKCYKFVRGDMHHGCRISSFEGAPKDDIMEILKVWLKK